VRALGVSAMCAMPVHATAAPRVQVRGTSRIELRVSGAPDALTVMGTLRDDVGAPIAGASVALVALGPDGTPIAWKAVRPCANDNPSAKGEQRPAHIVETDDVGGFCARAVLDRSSAIVRSMYGGGPLVDSTKSEVNWNAAQRPLILSFRPLPERLDLDTPRAMLFVQAVTPTGIPAGGLPLVLEDVDGRRLAAALTDDTGAAHFDVATSELGEPGIGAVRARFGGRQDLAPAATEVSVTRVARVRLEPIPSRVEGDPTRGVSVTVRAVTVRGSVRAGAVEATAGQEVACVAPVRDGTAEMVLSFQPRRNAADADITLRYRSDASYYEPGVPAMLRVHVAAQSMWHRLVPVLLAAVVAGWLLRGWRRPKRRDRPRPAEPVIKGVASVQVVGRSTSRRGWSGRVVDAHQGTPIAGARIRVIVPTFVDLDVIIDARADGLGRFAFEVNSSERDLQLRVSSELHGDVERPLPPPSELAIALVSRRRLLLDRLVNWARRAGKPWYRSPEPTPGHVIRVARRRNRATDDVAAWAERVQRRAFGPEPVDAAAEREVREAEPRGQPLR
jgi:hypothetical protein